MTKLGRHIDVIMMRPVSPVILHIAGIVVGYWRNGCSYRNIAREVGLHSNTVYGIIKRFCERGNLLYRFAMENRRFSVQRLRRA